MFREFLIYFSSFVGFFAVSYYLLSFRAYRKFEKSRDFKDKELPEVTIVIPAYNEEKSIKTTLKSALGLRYPKNKLKIFVVDDGSKDKTYDKAKSVKDKCIKVFKKENGGKATALNFGIKRIKSKFFVTMDADSYADSDSLRKMMNFFTDKKVMCVTPSMVLHNPKGFWQRIQQAEYFLGIFLRKAFSTMDAIHVTPGAFTAYRKEFLEKYGYFEEGNVTEDMELALRIQDKGYSLRCSDDSIIFTDAPNTFVTLLKQRRRWYYGWIQNLLKYRKLFSREYGHMGTIVLPVAVTTILLSMVLSFLVISSALGDVWRELVYLKSVNFSFSGFFDLSLFALERFFFYLFSKPVSIILFIFMGILAGYMMFARNRVNKYTDVFFGMFLFALFYSILLTFWWLVSAFYYFIIGKVDWGKQ
ncbi:MAG: glycosyltransferase [archaeon]